MASPTSASGSRGSSRPPSILPLVYLGGFAASYWNQFIWFYLTHHFHTHPATNLMINAGFGLLYTAGCLALSVLSHRLEPRSVIAFAFVPLIFLAQVSGVVQSVSAVTITILIHAFVIAWTWPSLEALQTDGLHGRALGAAVSRYNIAWAVTAAFALAVSGKLYDWHPLSFVMIPSACWAIGLGFALARIPPRQLRELASDDADSGNDEDLTGIDPHELSAFRILGRWGNLGSYILLSALTPTMPTIAANLGFALDRQTLAGSVWLFARVASFFLLGRWHGWHFRPRLFLGAMLALPLLFGAIVVTRSPFVFCFAQVLLGLALGLIYSSALFYSTHGTAGAAHTAYHEAVIGLGIMTGPLLAAAGSKLGERTSFSATTSIAIVIVSILLALWLFLAMTWKSIHSRGPSENS